MALCEQKQAVLLEEFHYYNITFLFKFTLVFTSHVN